MHAMEDHQTVAAGPIEDPGWRPAIRGVAWVPMPWVAIRRTQRLVEKGRLDGLLALRSLFMTYVATLVLIGIVVAILEASAGFEEPGVSAELGAGFLAVIGVAYLVASRFLPQPLDCSSDEKLAGTYRSRFFLRIAFANAVALLGLVAYIQTGNPLLYPLALIFTVIGFAQAAPTTANLGRDQEELTLSGCGRSLVAALRS